MSSDPIDAVDEDDADARLANWRDIAMRVEPIDLERNPRTVSRAYKRPMLATNCTALMRRRATVAASELGLSKDAWLRLVAAHALHLQLGDDIDELLEGSPKIYRYEAPIVRVDE